jgi:hypothetical protein
MVCRVGVGTDWRTCVVRIAIRIVWKAVILCALICKLCLKKKILSRYCTRGDRSPDSSADVFFNIVLTLVRRVESAETGSDRLQYDI